MTNVSRLGQEALKNMAGLYLDKKTSVCGVAATVIHASVPPADVTQQRAALM